MLVCVGFLMVGCVQPSRSSAQLSRPSIGNFIVFDQVLL